MSIPRRHHYVPRTHIRRFKTVAGYLVYKKNTGKFQNYQSSKQFFFEKDLNSTLDINGEINHKILEDEFTRKWDNKFNYHCDKILNWIKKSIKANQLSIESIQESLKFFFEYGLLGKFRILKKNKIFQNTSFDSIKGLKNLKLDLDDVTDSDIQIEDLELGKTAILDFVDLLNNYIDESEKKLKYPVPIPTDVKIIVPKECSCDILIALESSFLLSDTTSLISRTEETFDFENNQFSKVCIVCIPITPYVLLQIKNNEVVEDKTTDIYGLSKNRVSEINKMIYFESQSQVLTIEEKMLQDLLNDSYEV